jgi:hypothetical protein
VKRRLLVCSFIALLGPWSTTNVKAQNVGGAPPATTAPHKVQQARQVTTTLLSTKEAGKADGALWVQTQPEQMAYLQFDFSSLPSGLSRSDFRSCSLRLMARQIVYAAPSSGPNAGGDPVMINGKLAADDFSGATGPNIVALTTLIARPKQGALANDVAMTKSERPNDPRAPVGASLCERIFKRYDAGESKISLQLSTHSRSASSLLYANEKGVEPSDKPRLVITYVAKPERLLASSGWTQHQHDPEHSGRHAWKTAAPSSRYQSSSIAGAGAGSDSGSASAPPLGVIAHHPLIFGELLYVIRRGKDAQNYLVALDGVGFERWRQAIGKETVERAPAIGPAGVLYVATRTAVTGYDLRKDGASVASYKLGDAALSAFTDLTVGRDGSVFLALEVGGWSCAYGLSWDLVPFLKTRPYKKISTLTLGADGRTLSFQTDGQGVSIALANPTDQQMIQLPDQQEHLYPPVSGTREGYVLYASYAPKEADKGSARAYASGQELWNSEGPSVSLPVVRSDGRVSYLQDKSLHVRSWAKDAEGEAAPSRYGTELATSSSLVLDAADTLYFLQAGRLRMFDAQGAERAIVILGKLPHEQATRWMLGADGTLWAHNQHASELLALVPEVPSELRLEKDADIHHRTTYAALRLQVGAATVPMSTDVLFQASDSVRFGPGFRVQKGAELLVRMRPQFFENDAMRQRRR